MTSGVPTPLVGGSLQSIIINGLAPGQIYFFMVRARDEEPNLGGLSNSTSSAATVSTPLGVGKHDDKNVNLFYGGTWTNQASFAAYASGLRYSQVVGNSAGFMFSGTDFVLSYLASKQQGMLDIYIDGAKITSLNQFNATNAWQRKWNSPILTNGIHSVQFVHASGGRVNVDAIQVQATIPVNWPIIGLESVVSGLAKPVLVTHAGDGSGRLFIVEKGGTIRIFQGGSLLPTPFLDITARVASAGERGLLSMAFPPDYANKDYFYVFYTNLAGTLTVSRFSLTIDPTAADDTSEQIILSVPHSANANHNGGHIAFSPVDGYLYFSSGDGGGAGDPSNNGQNKNTLLGKILRIDVETGNPATYTVPATNPFVGVAGLDEIWAYGLRNPWRFSFDRLTGDLYIGDVGQGAWEEVDFQSAGFAGGANYGWRIWEGKHCYSPSAGCIAPPAYVPPVAEYSHSLGCSITGGYVYRGSVHPTMQGIYFASDYCSGRIFGVQNVGGVWVQTELLDTPQSIVSFGEDEAGNLYITAYNGTIYRVVVP